MARCLGATGFVGLLLDDKVDEDFACCDEEEQQKSINERIPSGLPLLCENTAPFRRATAKRARIELAATQDCLLSGFSPVEL